jgi:archaeal flagellar protein FlaF
MAVAEIIGAAVGVLLLVVVAYLLVGGTLSTADTVISAQKDITSLQENRLGTKIEISNVIPPDGGLMNFSVSNNGTTSIKDMKHMDVILYDQTNGYTYYWYAENPVNHLESLEPSSLFDYEWTDTDYFNDNIHTRQLDPGVTMKVEVKLPTGAAAPESIQVTTSNGISAFKSI